MMSFIHNENETRIQSVSCVNKLARWMVAHDSIFYKYQAKIFIMATQNWSLLFGFGVTDKPCVKLSQDYDVTVNFQFQKLGSQL